MHFAQSHRTTSNPVAFCVPLHGEGVVLELPSPVGHRWPCVGRHQSVSNRTVETEVVDSNVSGEAKCGHRPDEVKRSAVDYSNALEVCARNAHVHGVPVGHVGYNEAVHPAAAGQPACCVTSWPGSAAMAVCVQRLILNQLDGNPLDVNVTQRLVAAVLMTVHAVGCLWARLRTGADGDTTECSSRIGSLNNELRQAWPPANIRAVLRKPPGASTAVSPWLQRDCSASQRQMVQQLGVVSVCVRWGTNPLTAARAARPASLLVASAQRLQLSLHGFELSPLVCKLLCKLQVTARRR